MNDTQSRILEAIHRESALWWTKGDGVVRDLSDPDVVSITCTPDGARIVLSMGHNDGQYTCNFRLETDHYIICEGTGCGDTIEQAIIKCYAIHFSIGYVKVALDGYFKDHETLRDMTGETWGVKEPERFHPGTRELFEMISVKQCDVRTFHNDMIDILGDIKANGWCIKLHLSASKSKHSTVDIEMTSPDGDVKTKIIQTGKCSDIAECVRIALGYIGCSVRLSATGSVSETDTTEREVKTMDKTNANGTIVVTCKYCGKQYSQYTERQPAGYREREEDVCPHCCAVNGSSTGMSFHNECI